MRSMMVGAAALFLAVFALSSPALAAAPVAMIDLDGAITPVTARLLTAAIERAQAERAQALIVPPQHAGRSRALHALHGPGHSERRDSRHRLRGAHGARAASAGVFITMAAHVAAMAPATNIGAAHPVTIGRRGHGQGDGARKSRTTRRPSREAWPRERGRNVDWAEKAVRCIGVGDGA